MRTLLLHLSLRGSRGHFEEPDDIGRIVVWKTVGWEEAGNLQKFRRRGVVVQSGRRTRCTEAVSSHRQEKGRKGRKRWVRIELCLSEPNTCKYRGTRFFLQIKTLLTLCFHSLLIMRTRRVSRQNITKHFRQPALTVRDSYRLMRPW